MSSVDPLDKERTDEAPKSGHVTRRDLKILGIVLVVALILLFPAYIVVRGYTHKYLCGKNFESMGKAINLYAEQADDRLPPVSPRDGQPFIDEDGFIQCWASIPAFRDNMRKETSVTCPAAPLEESVPLAAAGHVSEPLTYGMYMGLSAVTRASISDPATTLVIAETSNFGTNDTYDPVKFKDEQGNPVRYDGYTFAWDTSNTFPAPGTRLITRLAYPGTADGRFKEDGPGRHSEGNHFVTLDGRRLLLTPNKAYVQMNKSTQRPEGLWSVPFSYAGSPP
jgi:hypothetical protein